MDWAPTASSQARELRARVYRGIRGFFDHRGVLEVQTPVLSRSANTDPNIESFASSDRYLRTSPEFPLKRLLATDCGPIYELGPVFRRGERGANHNVEFTMLEWYRPGFDHFQLMDEVSDLVTGLFQAEGRSLSVVRSSYRDLVAEHCGLDPIDASDGVLLQRARDIGGHAGPLDRSACLDMLMAFGVAPRLPTDELHLIHGFPACQAALARLDEKQPGVALRFEVFIGAREIANGYNELCDAVELEWRMGAENIQRRERGQAEMPVDHLLLSATAAGIGDCAGVALGVDRLLMSLMGARSMDEVINFPEERA